jgi:phospholipase/carboxylesterase
MDGGREILPHELYVPAEARPGVPVVVLLHGRGSHRGDLFSLQRHLPQEWAVVAPDAPFPGAPWGYGGGYAWYRYLGGTRPEPESYSGSLSALDALLDLIPVLVGGEPGPVVLGGFSQGGTVSTGYALSRPGRVAHVLNFSGFLADHPAVRVVPENTGGTRFFWGHGTQDGNIPFDYAVAGRAALRSAGADLEARDYAIGHWIDPTELDDAVSFLRAGGL